MANRTNGKTELRYFRTIENSTSKNGLYTFHEMLQEMKSRDIMFCYQTGIDKKIIGRSDFMKETIRCEVKLI